MSRVRIGFMTTPEQKEALEAYAEEKMMSVSAVIRQALMAYLADKESELG